MSDIEQNLDMNLVSSKVKQLINNIFENVGKIIELNTRQIYEYREILYKLDTSKNIKYLNLIDFIKKVENNFNENHSLSLEILESLKFLPPENFKEEYIKVIKKEEESPFDFIDNTNKSGEESISERFYFSIEEDSNKEKTDEKNNTFKILNEKTFELNEPKEKFIKKFTNCLKLIISKVNNIIYGSNESDIPDIDDNDIENSDKIIDYFNKILRYKIRGDSINLSQNKMNIHKTLKDNIIKILTDNDFTILKDYGMVDSDSDNEAMITKEDVFDFNKIKEKLYYFINIISNKSDTINNKDLENISKCLSKRISLHNNNLILLNNFPIDNFIKSECFENLSLDQINKYSFFSKFSEIKMLKNNLLIEKYKISQDYFDNRGNFLIPNSRNIKFRGKELYDPPYDWIGIGLNVLGKYEKDNNWLEDISDKSDWAIAYRSIGSNKYNNSGKKINYLKYFIEKGFKRLKNGVAVTPNIKAAEKYANTIIYNNTKYKVLFMTKVNVNNIKKREILKDEVKFWLSDADNVKIYRVLFKKIN